MPARYRSDDLWTAPLAVGSGDQGVILQGPEPGTCEVWVARRQDARPRLHAFLDDDERQRHAYFRRQGDRERFTVAHALTRLVLAARLGCSPLEIGFVRGSLALLGECPKVLRRDGSMVIAAAAHDDLSSAHRRKRP
jgi:hypothetical protein